MISFAKMCLFFLLFPAFSLHAMQQSAVASTPAMQAQPSNDERAKIVRCVRDIRFALKNPGFFMGPAHMQTAIMGNLITIREILSKYAISYPNEATTEWLEELTQKYAAQPKSLPRPSSQEIAPDIQQPPALLGMSEPNKTTIKRAIKNIESATSLVNDQERAAFVRTQIRLIEGTLNVWLVRYPQEKTMAWLADLKEQLGEKRSETVVDIAGLPKLAVLRALYFQTRGKSFTSRLALTDEELTRIIHDGLKIDYIADKALKVDLTADSFDCELYDRNNGGTGTAQEAITELRKSIKIS